MESLFTWMKENQGKIHPLLLSCIFHYEFVFIHPFKDGNGRMARLMMNYVLISSGYLPLSIPLKYREQYFNSLEEFKVNKTVEPFMALMMERLEREYEKMIDVINRYKK